MGNRFKKIQSYPKILTKFSNTTLLNIIIKNLEKFGLEKNSFLCGRNKEIISKYTKANKKYFFFMKKLLGTAGCMSNLNKKLNNDILVIFGDLLFDIDFSNFLKFHKKNKSDVTVFSHPSDHLFDSDILNVNKNNIIKKIFLSHIKKNNLK